MSRSPRSRSPRPGARRPPRSAPPPAAAAARAASRSARLRAALAESWRVFGVALALAIVIFLASAPIYFAETRSAGRWQIRLAALPDAAATLPPGTPAVLEGRIAPSTPPLFRHFAAYVHESQRGAGRGASWFVTEDTRKSAFVIETASGGVRLVDADYDFSPRQEAILPFAPDWRDEILRDWDHVAYRDGTATGTSPAETSRYRGLVPGEPVLAIGRIAPAGGFDADHVIAGDRRSFAAHLARMAAGAHNPVGFGFTIAGLAAIALVLAGWSVYLARATRAP